MDETFFQEWTQELRAFNHYTVARLQAHEEWKQAHEHQMREMRAEHTEQMREMRAEFAVWVQTWNRQEAGLQAIAASLAQALGNQEERMSAHRREHQEIITTLQAIRNSL